MKSTTIDAIKAAGFDIYMRSPGDSWCKVVGAAGICAVEESRSAGLRISTCHKPSAFLGTGFLLFESFVPRNADDLGAAINTACHTLAPNWHHGPALRKWPSIDAFLRADSFNAGYRKI